MAEGILPLRGYQREAIDAVTAAWRGGVNRPAVVLPTGAGKTVVFAHMAKEFLDATRGKRVLVLAHRTELVDQAYSKLRAVAPNLRVGRVQAERNETMADAIVGCVPTLASERRRRQLQNVGLVVVDECHHATAKSYRDILEHCGCMRDSPEATPTVGVTATLVRGDGGALGDIWQSIAYQRDIPEMIRDGYLVRPRGKRIKIDDLSFKGLRIRGGDYSDADIGERLEASMAPAAIARAYLEYGNGAQGIMFAPTVHSAEIIAGEFVGVGVSTGIVHGATPKGERRKTLDEFRAGKIRMLCNCMVLTEGTDLPMAEVAIIARPTLHSGLYVQMVGRVLRPHPGKDSALVLDVVGVSQKHALTAPIELFGEDAADEVDPDLMGELDDASERGGDGGVLDDILYRDGPLSSVEVDLFHGSSSMWDRTAAGIWFIPAGDRYIAIIPAPTPGHWDVVAMHVETVGRSRWITRDVADLSYAMAWAEGDVTPIEESTARKDRTWRKRSPTVSQLRYARRLGVDDGSMASRGEVSRGITRVLATRRIDPLLPAYARALIGASS